MTYIFDFDGTLVDSMPYWSRSILNLLDESGVSYPQDIIRILTPMGGGAAGVYMHEKLGVLDLPQEINRRMGATVIPGYRETIPAKEGVEQALRVLKARGDSLNVLTASPHLVMDPCLKRVNLWNLFDHVWACEDFGLPKSNPEIYRRVAERLNRRVEECVFLDDNIHSLETAKQAGMRVMGVYDEVSAEDADRIRGLAERYLVRMTELLEEN